MTKKADNVHKQEPEQSAPSNGHDQRHETRANETGLSELIKTVETAVEANPVGGALAAFGVGFVVSRLLAVGARSRD